jgi:hypothetical protein
MEKFDTLEQAIDLFRSGDKAAASRLLAQQVTQDPNNDQAWLWLAACVEQPEKQEYCLAKAKALDPTNPGTMEAVKRYLGVDRPLRDLGSPINLPPPAEPVWSPAPADEPAEPLPEAKPEKKGLSQSQTTILTIILALIVIILVVLIYLVLVNPDGLSTLLQSVIGGGGLILPIPSS